MKLQIKNRWNNSVIFEGEAEHIGELVKIAISAKANLGGANLDGSRLVGANLGGANLDGSRLVGANLYGASLVGASLVGANLDGSRLVGANLGGANLGGASLVGANLGGASLDGSRLVGANLDGANLYGASLVGANLYGASLVGANLYGASLPWVPKLDRLDSRILEIIERDNNALDMSSWHTCETTHCRAGWAITLAGDAGKVMESLLGPSAAGALLYARAYPDLPIPNFSASDEDALTDIKKRAATDKISADHAGKGE